MKKRITAVCAVLLLFAVPACNGEDGGGDADTGDETEMDTSEEMDTSDDEMDTSEMDIAEDTEDDAEMDSGTDTSDGSTDTSDDGGSDVSPDADGGGPSAMSVRDLRSTVSLDIGESTSREYTVTDVIVTGLSQNGASGGFFVQDASGPPENSGLWVFTPNNNLSSSLPTIERGTVLEITGTITNYDNMGNSSQGGLLEMEKISSISVLNPNGTLPSPAPVAASDVALSGSDSESYEGVLIEVTNVKVANGPNDFDDTELQSGLFIGPKLYQYNNDKDGISPSSGDTLSSVVGPLNFSYDQMEISPRDKNDITQ